MNCRRHRTDIVRYDASREKERKVKKKEKYYKYHCNRDGFESWILESNLQKWEGCSLCNGLSVVKGINDIATTGNIYADVLASSRQKTAEIIEFKLAN